MIELPGEMFVRPVDGADDTFAFRYDFLVEGKAVEDAPAEIVTELENGDLIIEGYAAVFDGLDRQNENFAEGAFERGIKSFLNGTASLNYHHKHDTNIGSVLDLREEEGKGLKMKARVDFQEKTSPIRWIYDGIRKGSIKGLSVGGFFKRKLTELGYRISDCDFTEISVTPVPVHPGTSFAVVAGKALENEEAKETKEPGDDVLENLSKTISEVSATFDRIEESKALPRSHNPKEAVSLALLLRSASAARETASSIKENSENEELSSIADEAESSLAGIVSNSHKLAAKIGPLPSLEA